MDGTFATTAGTVYVYVRILPLYTYIYVYSGNRLIMQQIDTSVTYGEDLGVGGHGHCICVYSGGRLIIRRSYTYNS